LILDHLTLNTKNRPEGDWHPLIFMVYIQVIERTLKRQGKQGVHEGCRGVSRTDATAPSKLPQTDVFVRRAVCGATKCAISEGRSQSFWSAVGMEKISAVGVADCRAEIFANNILKAGSTAGVRLRRKLLMSIESFWQIMLNAR
jgi:hypothetical protein